MRSWHLNGFPDGIINAHTADHRRIIDVGLIFGYFSVQQTTYRIGNHLLLSILLGPYSVGDFFPAFSAIHKTKTAIWFKAKKTFSATFGDQKKKDGDLV